MANCPRAVNPVCFNLSTRHEGTETAELDDYADCGFGFNLSTRHEGTETCKVPIRPFHAAASTYRPDMRVLKLVIGSAFAEYEKLQPIDPT